MSNRKKVTQSMLAEALNVTVQTVSKALSGKPGMSEQTRSRIFKAAEEMGYYTKEQIRSLILDRIEPYPHETKRFVIVQMNSSNYNRLLLQGLRKRLNMLGHQIERIIVPKLNHEKAIKEWIEEKSLSYTDGIFLTPTLPKAWETCLLEVPVPHVLIGYPAPGLQADSIIWDVSEAVWQAVMHLQQLGHSKIMYVGEIGRQQGYLLRWQSFTQALKEKVGVGVDAEVHFTKRSSYDPGWGQELEQMLTAIRPSAVLCGIDEDVSKVYDLCLSLGWRVPEDISIVGMLNEEREDLPPFSRPELPIVETGCRAADRMLWRLANPVRPFEHIRIQGRFVPGKTTAPVSKTP